MVALTPVLLDTLTKDKLEAVLAHEITHIVNRDVRLMVIATVLVGGLTLLGNYVSGLFSNWSGGPIIYLPSHGAAATTTRIPTVPSSRS